MDAELRLNWIACDAYGLCHDLLPELVALDDWGYPILPRDGVPERSLADAQRAVDCCPAKALRLEVRRGTARGAGRSS